MLSEGGVDWQITIYGGVVHSFTNKHADRMGRPDFARYDAKADARSWKQMSDLLAEASSEDPRRGEAAVDAVADRVGSAWLTPGK